MWATGPCAIAFRLIFQVVCCQVKYEKYIFRLRSSIASCCLCFYCNYSRTFDLKWLDSMGSFGSSHKTQRRQRSFDSSGNFSPGRRMGCVYILVTQLNNAKEMEHGRSMFVWFGLQWDICVNIIYVCNFERNSRHPSIFDYRTLILELQAWFMKSLEFCAISN